MSEPVENQSVELDVPSFDALFRLYAPYVWRVLGRLGVKQSDLHDASQEVFIVVHRRRDSFEGRSTIKTWIFGICMRVGAVYRRKNRFPSGNVEDAPELVATHTPDEAVDAERLRARLWHALASLDDERRAVFVLYELEDLTMPEVAEVVGCPLTTAYSRLHSARKALKTAFLRQKLSERSSTT